MEEMTLSTPKLEKTVSDVDINMMGIKSPRLYHFLKRIIDDGDLGTLEKNKADQILPELVQHMTVTIPNEILRNYSQNEGSDYETLKNHLEWLGKYLLDNFSRQCKYPFTIIRICELCYDPLKYYKVNELKKFTGAIDKCCMVRSTWEYCDVSDGFFTGRGNENITNDHSEDVSLTKIKWVDSKMEKELVPFLKEIDGLMSANFGFDEEDDEDMEGDINDPSSRNGDFIIEEYYEDVPKDGDDTADADYEDDGDDDYDDDYAETPTSDDADQYVDDTIEEPEEPEEPSYDDSNTLKEQINVQHHTIETIEYDTHSQKRQKSTPSKRKPTELDDFEYKESVQIESHLLTTPKKLKQGKACVLESPSITSSDNDESITPLHSQESLPEEETDPHSHSPRPKQRVSLLLSPKNNYDNDHIQNEGKIRELMDNDYDGDVNSPLGNKTR